jgi:hypothetical protein
LDLTVECRPAEAGPIEHCFDPQNSIVVVGHNKTTSRLDGAQDWDALGPAQAISERDSAARTLVR